ncbi:hypothetical protein PR048_006309 [Dryococelus australis]|uniref:Uncharacterized protein n=1 Tax=Dryococelus australis TaxID=614101 RepID=A0ABQ9IBU9_9NEOP|nr:hypothetical protein PR048_006309 [Dryococelus australis]
MLCDVSGRPAREVECAGCKDRPDWHAALVAILHERPLPALPPGSSAFPTLAAFMVPGEQAASCATALDRPNKSPVNTILCHPQPSPDELLRNWFISLPRLPVNKHVACKDCDDPELAVSTRIQGRGKREITEKARGPAASSNTIPKCENPGVTLPEIEPVTFLGDLPFPPPSHSSAASFSPHFILIGSQDLVVKRRGNLLTTLNRPPEGSTI